MGVKRILELIFPWPSGHSRIEQELKQQRDRDLSQIGSTKWEYQLGLALSEAERISTAEIERRRSSENKAATYLALVSALVTITLTFQSATLEGKAGPTPAWLTLLFVMLAVVYLAFAATFLFLAIQTTTTYQVHIPEIIQLWGNYKDPRENLIKEKLAASRYDQDEVNRKLTYINVAQRYIYNAAMVVVALILLNALWYGANALTGWPPSARTASTEKSSTCSRIAGTIGGEAPERRPAGCRLHASGRARAQEPVSR